MELTKSAQPFVPWTQQFCLVSQPLLWQIWLLEGLFDTLDGTKILLS